MPTYRRLEPVEILMAGDEWCDDHLEPDLTIDEHWQRTKRTTNGTTLVGHDYPYRRMMTVEQSEQSEPVLFQSDEYSDRMDTVIGDSVMSDRLKAKNPKGYGLEYNGQSYVIGFTGLRKNVSPLCGIELTNARLRRLYDTTNWQFQVSEGDDVQTVFDTSRPGSCMGEGKSGSQATIESFRQLYCLNHKIVKVLHGSVSDNPLLQSNFSCLLWLGKKRVYIDRLYSKSAYSQTGLLDSIVAYVGRLYPGLDAVLCYSGNGTDRNPVWSKPITFKLLSHNGDLPYMDTIRHVKLVTDTHITMTSESKCGRITASSTSGTRVCKIPLRYCCNCGDCLPSYYTTDQTYCESCSHDDDDESDTVECIYSGVDTEESDCSEVRAYFQNSWHEGWLRDIVLERHFTQLENGDYCRDTQVITTNRGEHYAPDDFENYVMMGDEAYHPDDVVNVDDEPQLKENCVLTSDDGWQLRSECVEIDDEWYLRSEVYCVDGVWMIDEPVDNEVSEPVEGQLTLTFDDIL